MSWKDLGRVFEAMMHFTGSPEGGPVVSQQPAPIPPDIERAADQWMTHWIETTEAPPLTPELSFALLPRFSHAASFAALSQLHGTPCPAGAEALKATLDKLLIGAWHRSFRESWLKGAASSPE
jgi:hypothetical protein